MLSFRSKECCSKEDVIGINAMESVLYFGRVALARK